MFSFFTRKKDTQKSSPISTEPAVQPVIYLDHASATPVSGAIFEIHSQALATHYANPGSIHKEGVEAKRAIENAREMIAQALSARTEEIIFTSSGTESNNLAIIGVIEHARASALFIPHVITTTIEHASVLEPLRALAERGDIDLDIVPVTQDGIIEIKHIRERIRKETVLVSVIHVNNEVGTVQPVRDIGKMIQKRKEEHTSTYPIFHVDACQSVLYYDLRPEAFKIDLCTLNSSKMYAPRGTGIVYKNKSVTLAPYVRGGNQEFGVRAGTENTASIVACAHALVHAKENRESEHARLRELQTFFFEAVREAIPEVRVWGSEKIDERAPQNINLSVQGVLAEEFVIGLSIQNIAISAKSACGMTDDGGSYVVRALGGTEQDSKESIRISMGTSTARAQLETVIKEMKKIVERHNEVKKYLV